MNACPPSAIASLDADLPDSPVDPAAVSRRARGRTTRFSGRLAAKIINLVRTHGISPSRAGLIAGVPTSTLGRWRQEDPDFADDLEAARVLYELPYLQQIASGIKRDGSKDWRAAAWLLERTNPELYARHHAASHGPTCSSAKTTPLPKPAILPENRDRASADAVAPAGCTRAAAGGAAQADPLEGAASSPLSPVDNAAPSSPSSPAEPKNIPENHPSAASIPLAPPAATPKTEIIPENHPEFPAAQPTTAAPLPQNASIRSGQSVESSPIPTPPPAPKPNKFPKFATSIRIPFYQINTYPQPHSVSPTQP